VQKKEFKYELVKTASDKVVPTRLFSFKPPSKSIKDTLTDHPADSQQLIKATMRSKQTQKRQNIIEENKAAN